MTLNHILSSCCGEGWRVVYSAPEEGAVWSLSITFTVINGSFMNISRGKRVSERQIKQDFATWWKISFFSQGARGKCQAHHVSIRCRGWAKALSHWGVWPGNLALTLTDVRCQINENSHRFSSRCTKFIYFRFKTFKIKQQPQGAWCSTAGKNCL